MIRGPNGAGKTSSAPRLLRDTVGIEAFVNADLIAAGLSGFAPQASAMEAGRILLARLRELAERRGGEPAVVDAELWIVVRRQIEESSR